MTESKFIMYLCEENSSTSLGLTTQGLAWDIKKELKIMKFTGKHGTYSFLKEKNNKVAKWCDKI
jgi:hypothetical protein